MTGLNSFSLLSTFCGLEMTLQLLLIFILTPRALRPDTEHSRGKQPFRGEKTYGIMTWSMCSPHPPTPLSMYVYTVYIYICPLIFLQQLL